MELIGKLAIHPTDVVVDYGCGPGFFTLELARRAQTVIAIDLSAKMLQKAKNKAAKAGAQNIRFLQSNGTKPSAGERQGGSDFVGDSVS